MVTLHVQSDHDTSRDIATLDELALAIPTEPRLPSIYSLHNAAAHVTVQVTFGSLDPCYLYVAMFSAFGTEKQKHDSIDAARSAFLALAQSAL